MDFVQTSISVKFSIRPRGSNQPQFVQQRPKHHSACIQGTNSQFVLRMREGFIRVSRDVRLPRSTLRKNGIRYCQCNVMVQLKCTFLTFRSRPCFFEIVVTIIVISSRLKPAKRVPTFRSFKLNFLQSFLTCLSQAQVRLSCLTQSQNSLWKPTQSLAIDPHYSERT